jgi:transcriptional regulator with XRE-family HTH domain
MATIRSVVGETLRAARLRQRRTLREVSAQARVSLGYLSEIERGQKEASSELLASICDALDLRLSDVFAQVSDRLRREEKIADRARFAPAAPGTATPAIAPHRGNDPAASVRGVPTYAA